MTGKQTKTLKRSDEIGWRYTPVDGHWDEAMRPTGFPRRHWRQLSVAVGRMGPRQLAHHWETGQQLIQANGITYNVYGDPQGKERPWPMDPIPLVIGRDEWAMLERAIVQRATLLNTVLADLYGPRHLIHDRRLPPELLYANPHFLRPCTDIAPPGGVHLHAYAADIARSPDGQWWVINDRTQAPSGMGYALENRLVSARTLPNVFSQCQVRQLARFFQAGRDALLGLAPSSRSTPRVVLLTPGPHNETYFEHSFLARHYGFPLVEGADLTVRDNRVYLKTLSGLEPVDLILRRQDDSYCDPLELRGDSVLGVPGLVQAVRSGTVAIANALGSGLLETPAHLAFLPGLCRHMLGEELLMPSVATWWCGHAEARQYVIEHLDQVVVKPTFPRFGQHPEFGATLDATGRADLIRRIQAHPDQYLAQEQVALSTAPHWTADGLAPRHIVVRVFAAWDGQSYTALPGGLTRVSTAPSSLVVSMQMGGGSKDTWVLGTPEDSTPAPTLRPARLPAAASRTMSDLPSRVADNLFWMGRYAERVESIARLVRVLLPALSGEADFGHAASLETAVHLMIRLRYLPKEVLRNSIAEQRRQMARLLRELAFDQSQTAGAGWNLKQLRRVAWQIKEKLSADTWRVLQQLETGFTRTAPAIADQRFVAEMLLLGQAIVTLSAFSGLLMENTTRGHGWRFLDIGRRLERGLQSTELLRCGLAAAPVEAEPYLEMLLRIADSSITYRSRYLTTPRADLTLDLLLGDEANPRSVGFQVATLCDHIEKLPQRDTQDRHSLEQRLSLKLLSTVRLARIDTLANPDAKGRRDELDRLLSGIKLDFRDLSEALTARYLSHVTPSRLMAST
ncbi:MAG TPA: circularly permuted type 2 ATP-grasp protein [Paludibaculum sp.]